MPIDTSKTIVLVTGANRGIGFEIVAALLRALPSASSPPKGAPYHVYLCSRSPTNGQAALASLPPSPHNTVSLLSLDVSSASSIAAAVTTVQAETGRIDVLINNAGLVSTASDPIGRLRECLEANVIAPWAVTDAFKSLLLSPSQAAAEKNKRLIHVTSDLGSITKRTDPSDSLYNSPFPEYRISKAGLNMMAACHQAEMAKAGVLVFAYNPGFAVTSLTGEEMVETRRRMGAREPKECGEACLKIVEGERDEEANRLVNVEGHLPW